MAMIRCAHYTMLLVTSAIGGQAVVTGASLRKVWDLDLKKTMDAQKAHHTLDVPVLALRFAPDGRRLAAVVDLYGPVRHERNHLIVIDTHHPDRDSQIFEISGGFFVDENGPGPDNFGWSASGQIIYAGGAVIDIERGKRCDLPWRSLFITDNFAVAADRSPWDWKALSSHLAFFDAECQPAGTWDVREKWDIADASPDRGLLSVRQILQFPDQGNHLIVDPVSKKIVQRWSGPNAPNGDFADSGRAICAGSDVEASRRAPLTCWEVDTGKRIGEAPTVNGGDPFAAALHASRIVASDWRRRKGWFSYEHIEIFRRRVVWDFRTGKELLSWRPQFQSWDFQEQLDPSKPLKHIHEAFRFAISPDGEYIAEGGAGGIHLYRIQP